MLSFTIQINVTSCVIVVYQNFFTAYFIELLDVIEKQIVIVIVSEFAGSNQKHLHFSLL